MAGFSNLPRVTVVLPVRNEAKFIAESLSAVTAQDYPPDLLDIIVVDGMSTDATREIVRQFQLRHSNIDLIDNPGKIVPTGLNAAIPRARGEVVVRVDGHCEIEADYVSRCVGHLLNDSVDGVGGPVETVGQTPAARAIAAAMSSPFGVGNSAFRTVTGRTMLVDTIAFPAYTRSIIETVGPYDEELVRNQDDDYNYRVRKAGGKLLLAHDVRSRYYSRSNIRSLWRQYLQYGYWKVRVMQKQPLQMRPRQFVPPSFVAVIMLSLAFTPLTHVATLVFAFATICYAIGNLAASIVSARKADGRSAILLPVAFATIHVGFGLGFLAGLAWFWNRWGDRATRCSQSAEFLHRGYPC